MRRPDAGPQWGTSRRWTTLLEVLALPVVVLLLAAGYVHRAASTGPTGVPPATITTAAALPGGGGAAQEVAEATAVPAGATLDAPEASPAGGHTPAATPVVDRPPKATHTPTPTPTRTPVPTHTPTLTPTPILPTPDGTARTARVPILMYHHIEMAPAGAGELRRSLEVTPAAFEQQLLFLQREGYQSVGLRDLALYLTRGVPLPEKAVIITFDDGYRDNYTQAFPLLRRFGFTAAFFLVTAPIDAQNPDFVSWDQVREMHGAGMEFEPHSLDHPDMRNRSVEFLVYEILASKGAIEERTGEVCRFFAYPSGRYDQKVIDVLRSADFWGAVLTEQGATHTPGGLFELRRVRVQPDDGLDAFAVKLGLDW